MNSLFERVRVEVENAAKLGNATIETPLNQFESLAVKSDRGIYVTATKSFYTIAGFKNEDELFGKSDYETPWSEYADMFRLEDELSLSGTYKSISTGITKAGEKI